MATSFRQGAFNLNTWVFFVQYACCFGVELTMNNATALYFVDQFEQTTESAATIAATYGWMNLFARGTGGFLSDKANASMGMRGQVWVRSIFTMCLMFAFGLKRFQSEVLPVREVSFRRPFSPSK